VQKNFLTKKTLTNKVAGPDEEITLSPVEEKFGKTGGELN